jgi:acetyl esterase/lipase
VNWFLAHKAEFLDEAGGRLFEGDFPHVFISGDSAGAHLAALAVCITESLNLQEIYAVEGLSCKIEKLVLSHAVCEAKFTGFVMRPLDLLLNHEFKLMMCGDDIRACPWKDSIRLSGFSLGLALPPVMLVSSGADKLSVQTLETAKFLSAMTGTTPKLKFWEKAGHENLGHVFHISHPEWPESMETNSEIVNFLQPV